MKLQILTTVQNGNLKRNRNLVIDAIRSFEGKGLLLTFEKPTKKRSNNQNSYYWGVLIPITQEAIRNEWGEVYSADMCHELLKAKFLYYEKVNEQTGEIIRLPKSTTENTTTTQEEYHSKIREFLREWFNVTAPLPNEELRLITD